MEPLGLFSAILDRDGNTSFTFYTLLLTFIGCFMRHLKKLSSDLLLVFGFTVLFAILFQIFNDQKIHSHFLPACLSRLFETLQSLFWSIFGLLNLYVTNVKARHEFTEFVGATMFGTYNVISLVVLLNMLIAMMNNSYQLIAVSRPEVGKI